MIELKSSANNDQCFIIQSNKRLGQFCSSQITADLVCCNWLLTSAQSLNLEGSINSRWPQCCVFGKRGRDKGFGPGIDKNVFPAKLFMHIECQSICQYFFSVLFYRVQKGDIEKKYFVVRHWCSHGILSNSVLLKTMEKYFLHPLLWN